MADFTLLITDWYRQNKRQLPWRDTKDPYKIWLSEIILQQTKVEQGLSYYNQFVNKYPTVLDLAEASEQDVLNLWQGLGYYSRARNLHATAKYISNELNGLFPTNYANLLKLKGVGSYTAAAIASFAFLEPVGVVDGNVYRVLSRIFDIETPIDSTQGKKLFFDLAQQLVDQNNPDEFNQAIMEFGALQCIPSKPDCINCPLNIQCLAFSNATIATRPIKQNKTSVKNRYFHFLVFEHQNETYLQKRQQKDIWQNMYQFPLIETEDNKIEIDWKEISGTIPDKISNEIIHVLSHQRLHARFYHFHNRPGKFENDWIKIKMSAIQDYPLPRLIDRYLEKQIVN